MRKEELQSFINEMELVVHLFYEQKTNAGYKKLEGLIIQLANLLQTLYQYQLEQNKKVFNTDRLNQTLTETMQALEEKDDILVADLLQYDLLEQLEEIKIQLVE